MLKVSASLSTPSWRRTTKPRPSELAFRSHLAHVWYGLSRGTRLSCGQATRLRVLADGLAVAAVLLFTAGTTLLMANLAAVGDGPDGGGRPALLAGPFAIGLGLALGLLAAIIGGPRR